MRGIISYFIKYPVVGTLVVVLIFLFGYFGLKQTRYSFFPQSESRLIDVRVVYPGASPEEVEEGIVTKIENNLKGITGIVEVRSVSSENGANITIEGRKGYDIDYLTQDVKNAVDQISSFPAGMEPVVVFKQEARNMAISFAVTGNVSLKALKTEARRIEDELRALDGISKITLSGFPAEEIEIALDEQLMRGYNLTLEQVSAAIAAANIEVTGGSIKTERDEYLIRTAPKAYTAEELNKVVVKADRQGRVVRLSDLGRVTDRWSDQQPTRNYFNGKPSVTISVANTNDEDFLGIVALVKNYMEQYNSPEKAIQLHIIRDASPTLIERRDLLIANGLQGFALVVLILALVLNWRIAFWVAISIPISFAGMFVLASLWGITINVISLFGMILVVGILVDDGIVIAENIYQHWEAGSSPLKAAVDGTLEVFPSVVAAVLTTVVAFSTFYFLDGRLGDFFPDLAFVVIATLMVSLVEAALTLPSHMAHSRALTRGQKRSAVEAKSEQFLFWVRDRFYYPILRASLKAPLVAMAVPVALFIITLGGFKGGIIKTTFFPFIEADNITCTLELSPGTRDHVTLAVLNDIEAAARSVSDSLSALRTDGQQVIANIEKVVGPKTNEGTVNLQLLGTEMRNVPSYIISNAISKKVGAVPGAEKLAFATATPFGKPISVSLLSHNLTELEGAKNLLKEELKNIKDLKDVVDNDNKGITEISIELNENGRMLGLSAAGVMQQVRRAFFGAEAQRLQRGIDEVRVWARFAETERSNVADLEQFLVTTPSGAAVPLAEIVTLTTGRGQVAINHLDGQREVRVEADVTNPEVSANAIQANIAAEIMPKITDSFPNVRFSFEGQSKEIKKTSTSMAKAGPIILIVMLSVMAITFRSIPQTLVVTLMIPLGIIGAGWGHFFHNAQLSMFSGFGMIALLGIMVNDSIVFVSAMNGYLKEGMPMREALLEAGRSRFRPIMLTSITTVAGLAPLIFESSFQAQFLVPMAISVAYGLIISTYTTLLVLPAALSVLNSLRFYSYWIWTGKKLPREQLEPAIVEKESEEAFNAWEKPQ